MKYDPSLQYTFEENMEIKQSKACLTEGLFRLENIGDILTLFERIENTTVIIIHIHIFHSEGGKQLECIHLI